MIVNACDIQGSTAENSLLTKSSQDWGVHDLPRPDLPYSYQVYGLNICSELVLPQLLAVEGKPDITIRYGKVPRSLQGAMYGESTEDSHWQADPEQFLLHREGVAGYWARRSEVVIERAPEASDSDIRVFLLGSVLGFLLHQRRILALHASAIRTEKGAVLFTGHSGAGKSTTLGAMVQRGYAMLADDVSGIVLDEKGQPQVLPAFPSSRLWADSAAKLNRSTDEGLRVRAALDKYSFPIADFCQERLPLLAVYVLTPHNQPTIELQPVEETIYKFTYFLTNTYRKIFIKATGWEQEHFELISKALKTTRVVRVMRPVDHFLLDELVEQVAQDFASTC